MAFVGEDEVAKRLLACGFLILDQCGLKFSAPKAPLRFTHGDVDRGSIYATDDFLRGNGGFRDLQDRSNGPPDDFGRVSEPIWRGKSVVTILDFIAEMYPRQK